MIDEFFDQNVVQCSCTIHRIPVFFIHVPAWLYFLELLPQLLRVIGVTFKIDCKNFTVQARNCEYFPDDPQAECEFIKWKILACGGFRKGVFPELFDIHSKPIRFAFAKLMQSHNIWHKDNFPVEHSFSCQLYLNMNLFRAIAFFALFFTLLPNGRAQSKIKPAEPLSKASTERMHATEDTLAILAYAVINDSIERERFAACRQLITGLVKSLKTENSFKYPFDRLKSISILAPPDSSFRIFTWQLFVNDSTYRYYGALQRNSKDLVLFPLIDRSSEMDVPAPRNEILTPDRWYGALYYNLRQFDTKQGRKYLLFGYDAYTFFEKRKIIDVLSFDKEDKPIFGAPVFHRDTMLRSGQEQRMILEYSAEASVKCNWDELYKMVLFEHLIPMGSPFGRGLTYVPDGSYDGLRFEKGRWEFITRVFHDVQAEPPSIESASDKDKKKDINGHVRKEKKKKSAKKG